MFYTSRRVGGEEAYRIGLADALVPQAEVRSAAQKLAAEIAENSPLGVLETRATMRAGLADRVRAATDIELEKQTRLRRTADFKEGVNAVNERRARSDRTRATCLVGSDELRPGDPVTHGERTIGRVVHSGYSAARGAWIAHALLAIDAAEADVDVYLAGGKPVVSTSIRDVVRPYGELGLARIADAPADFVAAVEACLAEDHDARRAHADALLAQGSWDATWSRMEKLLDGVLGAGRRPAAQERADV